MEQRGGLCIDAEDLSKTVSCGQCLFASGRRALPAL